MGAQKSSEQIELEYKNTLRKAKFVSGVAVVTLLPWIYLMFTDSQSLLSAKGIAILSIAIVGQIVSLVFLLLYWKCPACDKYPGPGWNRTSCRSCGVAL